MDDEQKKKAMEWLDNNSVCRTCANKRTNYEAELVELPCVGSEKECPFYLLFARIVG
jgi:hypothetical protein